MLQCQCNQFVQIGEMFDSVNCQQSNQKCHPEHKTAVNLLLDMQQRFISTLSILESHTIQPSILGVKRQLQNPKSLTW